MPIRLHAERGVLHLDAASLIENMRKPSRRSTKRLPQPTRRRALELLAASPDGCTEAILRAHGFTIEQMVTLVRAGLATATADRVVMGPDSIEVARERLTEKGRRALAGS